MEKKTIGTFLTALRKASGLTQRQLAEKLNVSDKAVSRWERDECAPDLSLIPVLAEIYGVSSDEILRGQRINPESPQRDTDSPRADKQRKQILASTRTKFLVRSIISITIAITGMIIACICNYELGEASIGFLLNSIFCVVAMICQISFTVFSFAAVTDDDWQDIAVNNCKGLILFVTVAITSGIILLFAGMLPLAGKSHTTVSFLTNLSSGIFYAWIGAIICFIAGILVHLMLRKQTDSPRNKLRRRCWNVLSAVLIVLMAVHIGLNGYLINNKHVYGPCDTFERLKKFEQCITRETSPDGFGMYHDFEYSNGVDTIHRYVASRADEVYLLKESDIIKQLITKDVTLPQDVFTDIFTEEYGYTFKHLNLSIVHY